MFDVTTCGRLLFLNGFTPESRLSASLKIRGTTKNGQLGLKVWEVRHQFRVHLLFLFILHYPLVEFSPLSLLTALLFVLFYFYLFVLTSAVD